jgi:hypothetical protein
MAETYSAEYQALYITKPPVKTPRQNVQTRVLPFTYTQVLAGTAADTVVLQQLPPFSQLYLPGCVFYFAGFTAAMTLSIGWKAYTDQNGVLVAANPTGLFNAATVSNGVGMLHGGMMSTATPDDVNPVAAAIMRDFQNMTPVDILATFNGQPPGVNATLVGYLFFGNIG